MAKVKTAAAVAAPTKRNLATFAAAHDRDVMVPNKIKAALAAMVKEGGMEHYEYEAEFIRRAGISGAYLATYRHQFVDHIVEVKAEIGSRASGKKVWFATAKAALKARGGPATPIESE